ncbi:hypothetical protein [uncultured Sunxiuqinia sp.]|uniref:hypothetical protein n=1 Tax=uncultured Sunxiuqinia sp. TaxID=1573825 RepID=UPI002AA93792|nr:hypothetical protein [uncultured Sunxiuqinia sp.]
MPRKTTNNQQSTNKYHKYNFGLSSCSKQTTEKRKNRAKKILKADYIQGKTTRYCSNFNSIKKQKIEFPHFAPCHSEDEHLSDKSGEKQETSKNYLAKSIVVSELE